MDPQCNRRVCERKLARGDFVVHYHAVGYAYPISGLMMAFLTKTTIVCSQQANPNLEDVLIHPQFNEQ